VWCAVEARGQRTRNRCLDGVLGGGDEAKRTRRGNVGPKGGAAVSDGVVGLHGEWLAVSITSCWGSITSFWGSITSFWGSITSFPYSINVYRLRNAGNCCNNVHKVGVS